MRKQETLVLSMKHLKKSTQIFLSNDEGLEFMVLQLPDLDGFMICMDDDFAGVPGDLKKCLEFAKQNDADWLRFDEEEDIIAELPIYNEDNQENMAMSLEKQILIDLAFQFQKLQSEGKAMNYEEITKFFHLERNPRAFVRDFIRQMAWEFERIWQAKLWDTNFYQKTIQEFGEREILAVFSKNKIASARAYPYEDVYIYIPSQREIIQISEGTGDNLLKEDIAEGCVDYIYYSQYDVKDPAEEADGGEILLKEFFREKYTCTEECIPEVLDMAYGRKDIEYMIL